jgi:hypothetical protein
VALSPRGHASWSCRLRPARSTHGLFSVHSVLKAYEAMTRRVFVLSLISWHSITMNCRGGVAKNELDQHRPCLGEHDSHRCARLLSSWPGLARPSTSLIVTRRRVVERPPLWSGSTRPSRAVRGSDQPSDLVRPIKNTVLQELRRLYIQDFDL